MNNEMASGEITREGPKEGQQPAHASNSRPVLALPDWEERWHPLREEWVIVAAHRQSRPWNGQLVGSGNPGAVVVPSYASDCYLCPGNPRVNGALNPAYRDVFVFDNDHPCVGASAPTLLTPPPLPYRNRPASGLARVICYHPHHNLTMAQLSPTQIEGIVQVWQHQTFDLGNRPEVRYVLCFENKGEVVGVSNPHPHGQIYATNFVFKTMETELLASVRYQQENGADHSLFTDIIKAEQTDGRRILYEDEAVIAFVPYFARYAYEVYVAPKRRVAHFYDLRPSEVAALSLALKNVTLRFDNLWQLPFPYVLTLHQAPTDDGDYRAFHAFIGFLPPLRQPNLLKYLAGPEIGGGNFLSDTLPEAKAAELKAVNISRHYSQTQPSAD